MRTLETPRLILRPLTPEDFEDYAAMLADPDVGRFLSAEGSMSREDSWRNLALFLGHQQIQGFSNFAVVEKDTECFVGRVGPWQPLGWPGLELGWCLARRFWGRGYATEAASMALRYCFDDLGAAEVVSLVGVGNTRSARVAERIGHQYRGDIDLRGVRCHDYGQARPT
ncbi:GNAT family N-acetyltransferase [Actinomadura vinacea]|uniref:GNAT family N-acetyltransferase n=1 Tax=Actinomadura vinacea TaxID=115336 RepID=A0ABP5WHP8_9ACTN